MVKTKEPHPTRRKQSKITFNSQNTRNNIWRWGNFSEFKWNIFIKFRIINNRRIQKNIKQIFGNELDSNSRIIEGGEYGHSYCYQNTNRNIIRFFQALGAPIGRKSGIELNIPEWILKDCNLQDHFFLAFLGNEIGIPKIHKDNRRTDSLDIGLVCKKELLQNRIEFLSNLQNYLKNKRVKAEKIYTRQHKQENNKFLMKLAINLNFDNLMNFYKNINISYSQQKAQKLQNTLIELQQLKLKRFNQYAQC